VPPLRRARRLGPPLLAAAALAASAAALQPATAAAVGAPQTRAGQAAFDARAGALAAAPGAAARPARALAKRLGRQSVVAIDPLTGTPRQVLRTDGTLTGPSDAAPAQIALDYVRAHRDVFELTDDDIAALGTPTDVVSSGGTHHLRWTQSHDGVPVTGAGLRAHVSADGRLLAVQGSPLPDTSVATTSPRVSAAAALGRVRRDGGAGGAAPAVTRSFTGPQRATRFSDDSTARLVVFPTPSGNRLAWSVVSDLAVDRYYAYLIDATTGAVLKRSNLVRHAAASGHGRVWSYAPSDGPNERMRAGYAQEMQPFGSDWIDDGETRLYGNNAWVYSDLDDDDLRGAGEEVVASLGVDLGDGKPVWDYPFQDANAGGWDYCSAAYPCSWRAFDSGSWQANREQNAVQAFWFVNRFHDHLRDAPGIGFDERSGNFQKVNHSGEGVGGDPVVAQTDDGADETLTNEGIDYPHHPDLRHLNNANMATPPDGRAPRMQMYLFTPYEGDPTIDANGGDDASVVYHEYAHGLSSRLVTDDDGLQALDPPQSGAMGEAWSDWYALDFLVEEGLQRETAAPGEVIVGGYLTQGRNLLRTAALDCPVDRQDAPNCPPGGGYTYGDYGRVWAQADGSALGPEVHADGEIWAQTLWDLRTAVIAAKVAAGGDEAAGLRDARALVTEGMRDSVPYPSFLDMRDQILVADQDLFGGAYHALLWEVFAKRGMGVYADTVTAYDPAPKASFALPPTGGQATLSGTVTDADTGAAIAGAIVWLPGMESGVRTDAAGRYSLPAANVDTYPRLNVSAAGYDVAPESAVTVAPGGSVRDVALRRNWALASGGAQATATAPDLTALSCGPADALDGTGAFGWASYVRGFGGDPEAGLPAAPLGDRILTVTLTQAVDVSGFSIDPGAVCGDDDSASLGAFKLETSADGMTWRTAATGGFTRADNHRMNGFAPNAGTGGGVRYVRVTMLTPQGGFGSSGSAFMDMAELAVHGTATPEPRAPPSEEPRAPPTEEPREEPRDEQPRAPAPVPRRAAARARRDVRRPRALLRLRAPRRHGLRALRSRAGLPLRVRFDEPVRLRATVTLPAATARRLGLTKRRRGSVTLSAATVRRLVAKRTRTVRLRVRPAVRRKLARARALRVVLTVTARDAAGNATTLHARPLLRR